MSQGVYNVVVTSEANGIQYTATNVQSGNILKLIIRQLDDTNVSQI